jgi:hypothetical protein
MIKLVLIIGFMCADDIILRASLRAHTTSEIQQQQQQNGSIQELRLCKSSLYFPPCRFFMDTYNSYMIMQLNYCAPSQKRTTLFLAARLALHKMIY